MTRLKATRKKFRMKLREVGERLNLTPAAVHMAETYGIQTRRTAQKYAAAFPGVSWQMLLDDYIGDSDNYTSIHKKNKERNNEQE